MTVDEIRELIALASETGIAELEVQRGDNRVRIRRAAFRRAAGDRGGARRRYAPAPTAQSLPPPPQRSPRWKPPNRKSPPRIPNLVLVKCPIVGTFYEVRRRPTPRPSCAPANASSPARSCASSRA